jgi:hypothetical protein
MHRLPGIRTGDVTFDRRFSIRSSDPDHAAGICGLANREPLMQRDDWSRNRPAAPEPDNQALRDFNQMPGEADDVCVRDRAEGLQ